MSCMRQLGKRALCPEEHQNLILLIGRELNLKEFHKKITGNFSGYPVYNSNCSQKSDKMHDIIMVLF